MLHFLIEWNLFSVLLEVRDWNVLSDQYNRVCNMSCVHIDTMVNCVTSVWDRVLLIKPKNWLAV
jgi:hypothetical protein